MNIIDAVVNEYITGLTKYFKNRLCAIFIGNIRPIKDTIPNANKIRGVYNIKLNFPLIIKMQYKTENIDSNKIGYSPCFFMRDTICFIIFIVVFCY